MLYLMYSGYFKRNHKKQRFQDVLHSAVETTQNKMQLLCPGTFALDSEHVGTDCFAPYVWELKDTLDQF